MNLSWSSIDEAAKAARVFGSKCCCMAANAARSKSGGSPGMLAAELLGGSGIGGLFCFALSAELLLLSFDSIELLDDLLEVGFDMLLAGEKLFDFDLNSGVASFFLSRSSFGFGGGMSLDFCGFLDEELDEVEPGLASFLPGRGE